MVDHEALNKQCQDLYQNILVAVESDANLQPLSQKFSAILTSSINIFERALQVLMKSNEQNTSKEPVDIAEVEKDVKSESTPNDDSQNNDESVEPQNLHDVNKPNDLKKPDEVKPVESNEPVKETLLTEFDEGVRNAVSSIYNDTVKNQAANQDDPSEDDDILVIDEENNECDANDDCNPSSNEQDDDNQFVRSEVVTQRTQHLMIQSLEGGFIEMGIREEVVTTTTFENRTETNESDFVAPGKRKAQDSQEDEKPKVKRRLSDAATQPQADLESKPVSKRRYSMGVRRGHLGMCLSSPYKATSSPKTPQEPLQMSKREQAIEKRRSNLRKTIASRRELEDLQRNETKTEVKKNNDKNVHVKNNFYRSLCMLCETKGKQLVQHYVKSHPEWEVFISRPSPEIANRLRLQNDHFVISDNKISGFCFFCEEEKSMTKSNWTQHLLTHTGELMYDCTACGISSKRLFDHKDCDNKAANIFDANSTDGSLMGYICNKCNYMQIGRKRMENHLKNQHGRDKAIEERHFQKVMLIQSPNPVKSTIASEYEYVKPEKRFKCTICSVNCNSYDAFEEHFDEEHDQITKYTCFCKEKMELDCALTGSYITAHLRTHDTDLFQCMACDPNDSIDSVFFNDKDVRDHLLNDHLLNEHSDSQFHYQHVHRGDKQPTVVTEVIVKRIICNICNIGLKTFGYALEHFENTPNHCADEVKVSGFMSKKESRFPEKGKKVSDIKTEYWGGDKFVVSF